MTFANAAERVRDGESGHSQVAITDLGNVPAERLHLNAVYSRCRPKRDVGDRGGQRGQMCGLIAFCVRMGVLCSH